MEESLGDATAVGGWMAEDRVSAAVRNEAEGWLEDNVRTEELLHSAASLARGETVMRCTWQLVVRKARGHASLRREGLNVRSGSPRAGCRL